MSLGKDLQALLIEFWPIEPMDMQELFPPAAAGLAEQFGSGELLHETPTRCGRPVLKGLQSRRIILQQSGLELVDHFGSFADELHLIAAEQPQFLDQWVQGL